MVLCSVDTKAEAEAKEAMAEIDKFDLTVARAIDNRPESAQHES